jgi:hypothetical protein
MGWILLESLVALLILVFIVWWTMRPRKRDGSADDAARRGPGR